RHKLNFTFENLRASDAACDRIQTLVDRLRDVAGAQGAAPKPPAEAGSRFRDLFHSKPVQDAADAFQAAMDDDLNTSRALASLFDLIRELNQSLEKNTLSKPDALDALSLLLFADHLLDILDFVPKKTGDTVDPALAQEVDALIAARAAAKKARDFKEADRIRDVLKAKGITITDTPKGTIWEKTH
ncbi:MAG: hypothetical protein HY042_07680, partial [Spirochaetia bacterium]|nr:hypothetical protein [Spirochaetia bacterium]